MLKPVILTVDGDAEVLRAIERDLRQRYRAGYRVLRSSSGSDSLEAARQLKQRGSPIALFLVDQRMPAMTGTEFQGPGSFDVAVPGGPGGRDAEHRGANSG